MQQVKYMASMGGHLPPPSLNVSSGNKSISILESDAQRTINSSPKEEWVCSGVGTPDIIDNDKHRYSRHRISAASKFNKLLYPKSIWEENFGKELNPDQPEHQNQTTN